MGNSLIVILLMHQVAGYQLPYTTVRAQLIYILICSMLSKDKQRSDYLLFCFFGGGSLSYIWEAPCWNVTFCYWTIKHEGLQQPAVLFSPL